MGSSKMLNFNNSQPNGDHRPLRPALRVSPLQFHKAAENEQDKGVNNKPTHAHTERYGTYTSNIPKLNPHKYEAKREDLIAQNGNFSTPGGCTFRLPCMYLAILSVCIYIACRGTQTR